MTKLNLSLALLTVLAAGPGFTEPLTAFDVAEDLTRFVYAETQRFEDDMPAYGNAFVTQGYIYPAELLTVVSREPWLMAARPSRTR